jgi:ACR3 family arsenite efflux pump ArsB
MTDLTTDTAPQDTVVAQLPMLDRYLPVCALLGYFYLELLPGWLGLGSNGIDVTVWEISKSVLIFLGVPLLAGFLTRTILERRKGTEWYEGVFLPRIGPVALSLWARRRYYPNVPAPTSQGAHA